MDTDCPARPAETLESPESTTPAQPILVPRWLRMAMRAQPGCDNGHRSGSRWQAARKH